MTVLVLGDVCLDIGGRRLAAPPGVSGAVLAALAVADHPLSVDRLYALAWGTRPTSSPETVVQVGVHRLRRWLAEHAGDSVRVVTAAGRYTLEADLPTDLERFRTLRAAADGARPLLEDALELWRGPALGSLARAGLAELAAELDRERVAAVTGCAVAALADGDPERTLTLAVPLAAAQPLDEGVHALVIDALTASGQQSAALLAFERIRRSLAEELGVGPGAALNAAHLRALRPTGPDPAARPAPVVQLPADTADFTGRAHQVTALRAALTGARDALPVVVLVGHAGVGKSTLAVHVAQNLGGAFPDGRLYLNLRGLSAADALARLLRALDVHGSALPVEMADRAAMFRERCAGRRLLVVLDDATEDSQLVPLLPGSPTCAVLVTSRIRLSGLPGARIVGLDVLEPDESVQLLRRIVGQHRADRPADARVLAQLCGHLPLALRVAGAKLAGRPGRTLGWLTSRLTDERRRLDELTHGDLAVRASLELSYRTLGGPERRTFRLLGALEARTVTSWVVRAMLGVGSREAEDLLDVLAGCHLLESCGPDRFRFHDLVRLYAKERAAEEEPPDALAAAVTRAVTGWLALARRAEAQLKAGPWQVPDRHPAELAGEVVTDPLAWFEAERDGIVAAVQQAARVGAAGLAWSLAATAAGYFDLHGDLDEWRRTHLLALEAAELAGDRTGVAYLRLGLARLASRDDDLDLFERLLRRTRAEFAALDDPHGLALTDCALAELARFTDDHDEACRLVAGVLEHLREHTDPLALLRALLLDGMLHLDAAAYGAAEARFTEGLAMARSIGCLRFTAQHQQFLGEVYVATGRAPAGVAACREAEALFRSAGDELRATYVRTTIAEALIRGGDPDQACAMLAECVATHGRLGDAFGLAQALTVLGEAHLAAGRQEEAVVALTRAGAHWRNLDPAHTSEEAGCAELLGRAGARVAGRVLD
ncbi:ATP-binding protein [Longispora urticae]